MKVHLSKDKSRPIRHLSKRKEIRLIGQREGRNGMVDAKQLEKRRKKRATYLILLDGKGGGEESPEIDAIQRNVNAEKLQ